MIPTGNNILTDWWAGYEWIEDTNSGYRRYSHIHGCNNFGHGISSMSHIESIWSQLKYQIKTIYKTIPSLNFLYFLGESEWRIKKKDLSYEQKFDDFFEIHNMVNGIEEEYIYDCDFLNNDDINIIYNEDDNDD